MVKIIFFDWDTFYGRVIKDVTNSDWSHVGIISDETETQYVVHEALNKGLVKQFYDKTFIDSKIKDGTCAIRELYCFEVTEDVFKKICQKYEGTPYDWLSIIHIGISIFLRNIYLNWSSSARAVICSEFVSRVLFEASKGNINLPKISKKKEHDTITPQDIWIYFQNMK